MNALKSTLITIIASIAASMLLTSCLDDTHNDDKNKHYMAATTLSKDNTGSYFFLTDDSIQIHAENINNPADSLLNLRFFITFQIQEQYKNEMRVTLTSNPLIMISDPIKDYSEIKNVGNDYVKPYLIWPTGKYLNMLADISITGKDKHDYYLFEKTAGNDTLKLEFRHDRHNDPDYDVEYRLAYSYDIEKYLNQCTADTLVVALKMKTKEDPNFEVMIKCPVKDNTKGFSTFK